MKKVGVLILLFVGLTAIVFSFNQFVYPPLPIESHSGKEVVKILEKSNQEVAEIGVEAGTIWFITKNDHDVDGKIQLMMEEKGWVFQEKDGAGLFFERDGERLIVTTEMWSKKYVLVKVPGVDEQR